MRAIFTSLLFAFALLGLLAVSDADVETDADVYVDKVFSGDIPAKGLVALYREARKFILTITGDGLVTTIARELGIDLTDPSNATIERIRSVKIETKTLLPKAAKAGAGYIVIIIIGIILTLFYFISCCCFFCCRKTGCCGGKVSEKNQSGSESLVLALLIALLFVVSLLLILAAYGAAASGLATSKGLKKDEESGLPFFGNIVKPIKGLVKFIPDTIKEINDTLDVDKLGDHFNKLLPNFPEIIQKELKALNDSCSSCAKLITSYKEVTTQSDGISKSLENIKGHEANLKQQYQKFNESLDNFKISTLNALSKCTTKGCFDLRVKVNYTQETRTTTGFEFPKLDGFDEPLDEVSKYSIDAFQFQNFSKETKEITKMAKSFIQNVKEAIDFLPLDSIERFDVNLSSEVKSLAPSVPWTTLDSVNHHLPRAIKALAIVTILVVVVIIVLNIVGVLFGLVCKKRSPKASQSTFLINSQLTFCLATLLCITTIPLFILGTLMYREVCWDVKKGSESTYFQLADTLVREQMTDLSNFSFEGVHVRIKTEDIKFITKTLYGDCKNNESLTKVLADNLMLDNSTVDAILKKFMPQVKKYVDSYNISELPIFSDDNIAKLRKAGKKFDDLKIVDIDPKNLTFLVLPLSLSELGNEMKNTVADLSEPEKGNLQQLIDVELPKLEKIAEDIENEEKVTINLIRSVKDKLEIIKSQIPEMLKDIPLAKTQITTVNIADKLLRLIETEVKTSFWNFYDYLKNKLSETAHCRALYENFDALVYGFCDLLVDPLNGFWICMGVCVVLLFPSFLVGLYIGGIFARKYKPNKVIYHS